MEFEGRRRSRGAINLVPLVNVVFLLLIFFMLAGTLRAPELFDLELPEALSGANTADDVVEVTLGADGRIAIDRETVARDGLARALALRLGTGDSPRVGLKVDARAPAGQMVDLLELLRAAGAETVFLTTRRVAPD